MRIPVFITGTGLVTPLDSVEQSTFAAIRAGRRLRWRGIVPESTLEQVLGLSAPTRDAARSFLTNPQLDKSIRLAYLAALQALTQAAWPSTVLSDPTTALFVGTSKGPILSALAAADHLRRGQPLPHALAEQVALGPAAMGTILARQLEMRGAVHTSVAACASGIHALHAARQAVAHGACRRALAVAADASVHPLFEGSFARLGVLVRGLPRDSNHDSQTGGYCDPFAATASGFFLSEAAAAVTVEAEGESGRPSTGRPLALATGIAADGTHLLAVDPESRSLRHILQETLQQAATPREAMTFVHAHATGTEADHYELSALRRLLTNAQLDDGFSSDIPNYPLIFSYKRYLGHSLGAAGLVGVVLSATCHRYGLTLKGSPLAATPASITIAQGFGGHIGVALLSSSPEN